MKKKLARTMVIILLMLGMLTQGIYAERHSHATNFKAEKPYLMPFVPDLSEKEPTVKPTEIVLTASEQPIEVIEEDYPSYDDILIAKVVVAESEGEPEYGQRLVIDTILNRLDDSRFPNAIEAIIYDTNQFDIFNNGRFNNAEPTERIYELIREEKTHRTNSQVLYFNSIGFNDWSRPLEQFGGHYFSTSY